MGIFSWMGTESKLGSDAMTVRAQTISPNDDGRLLYDAFFPRANVDSVKMSDITTLDFRPVADRREWNARGRLIPLRTPKTSEVEMTPIETYFTIAEREIQHLEERAMGNEGLFRQIVGTSIPSRVDGLVQALYRRLEVDAMKAWSSNQIVVMNPVTGGTTTVALGVDAARYTTAATAWNNGAVNAYEELLAWLEDSIDLVGPIQGVVMRLATFKEIQKDAPQGVMAVQLTRAQVEDRISQDLGMPFRFYIVELTQDIFTDGGSAVTRTKVWPAQKVAVVPQGETVGNTYFAPVARAIDMARSNPNAGIDVRGATVYVDNTQNGGRQLTVEAQINALPFPNEQRICVIDAGV